ncbi:MAG: hypothetical protein J0J15_12735, partial [Mesorhizobium sp.]|nr:hypothetical protein [Mesorhizobium sp.]
MGRAACEIAEAPQAMFVAQSGWKAIRRRPGIAGGRRPTMTRSLDGKVAAVTGAARGIGDAIATRLLA